MERDFFIVLLISSRHLSCQVYLSFERVGCQPDP
jgi:hypothetical protein